jgi:hypothetical protein
MWGISSAFGNVYKASSQVLRHHCYVASDATLSVFIAEDFSYSLIHQIFTIVTTVDLFPKHGHISAIRL